MKLAVNVGFPDSDWETKVEFVLECEKLGVESAWQPELWGYDAITPLAYLAAKTERIKLGTGIMQLGARTPTMTAMSAGTLAALSNDRFLLGLGVSGPQVVEGWYGVNFAQPYRRLKETIEIIKMVLRGERLKYDGEIYKLPLPGGEGKALVPSLQPRPNLPIYLATLGPKNLELTGELADGWLGTSFIPETASIFFDHIATGAQRAGRSIKDLDLLVWAGVAAFSDRHIEELIAARKPGLAFTLGAMGSREHNFYNMVYQRSGYKELALTVQDLWLSGRREEAIKLIPDDLILKTNLLGTDEMVKERLRVYRDAGVTTLRFEPDGKNLAEKLESLARLKNLLKEVVAEKQPPN
jgi:F420-dependent oxidoreductase-like protein